MTKRNEMKEENQVNKGNLIKTEKGPTKTNKSLIYLFLKD